MLIDERYRQYDWLNWFWIPLADFNFGNTHRLLDSVCLVGAYPFNIPRNELWRHRCSNEQANTCHIQQVTISRAQTVIANWLMEES